MKAHYPSILPEGKYRDYSFDKNNITSLKDALVDMNTGYGIRQLESFRSSKEFKDLIESQEDRDLLNRRLSLYVDNVRNKNSYDGADLGKLLKVLDKTSAVGVGMALGTPSQMIKQTIPVMVNTFINAGRLDLTTIFQKNFNDFLNESGYPIANRGIESRAELSSLNRKIEQASNPLDLRKAIVNANKWWLKQSLVKPDVAVARASWKAYYEKALRKQGESTKNLDYSKHEINKEAADYAQMMVDRQQNVSDHDLSGSLFSKDAADRNIIKKVFLNFANFRMNQSSRLATDLSTLGHWSTATPEDRAIAARSIGAYTAEIITFKFMAAGISILIQNAVQSMRGNKESKEEKDKRMANTLKGSLTSTITDTFLRFQFLISQFKLYQLRHCKR